MFSKRRRLRFISKNELCVYMGCVSTTLISNPLCYISIRSFLDHSLVNFSGQIKAFLNPETFPKKTTNYFNARRFDLISLSAGFRRARLPGYMGDCKT